MERCARTLLAETSECRIERCHCGVIHLTVGPLTFRVTATGLQSLARATGEAMHMLAPPTWGWRAVSQMS